MFRSSVLTLVLLLGSVVPAVTADEVLTNDYVVRMVRAGLSSEVIIAKIANSETDFDTSVDALIALAEAEVPNDIVSAMTGGVPAPAAAAAPAPPVVAGGGHVVVQNAASQAANVRTNFAGTPCSSPGIFVETPEGLREIDPTSYSQSKTKGAVVSRLTYGIKSIKSVSVVRGTTANTRIQGEPVFLFCFEESETGLSYETKGATSPSEFLLVELTVNPKKSQRELVTGKLNVWVGGQSGAPPKALREVAYEKLAPGVYRVTPRSVLGAGEYGIYYAGSAPLSTYGFGLAPAGGGGGKIFTFSLG